MCLAIPMQVISVDRLQVHCEARGIERTASLFLFQHEPVEPGDHVMIHGGQVIQKVSAADAEAAWALYDEILAAGPNEPVLPSPPGQREG